MKNKLLLFLTLSLGILLGFSGSALLKHLSNNKESSKSPQDYNYLTNPLLECDKFEQSNIRLGLVKFKIEKYIDGKIKDGSVNTISVYIRDLNNGSWVGINEKEEFAPASLLKVPIMIAFLKMAEKEPGLLNKKIRYANGQNLKDLTAEIPPNKTIEPGNAYSVNELIENMIVYSDNTSKNLLLLNIDEEDLNQVYVDLSLQVPGIRTPQDFMSVKDYASFFRILYNASYLNREMSERALELLIKADFQDGLVAGVPKNIKITHKFGERETSSGEKQLHDCGIVYYPKSPYVIIVMTKGKDLSILKGIISDISRITYEHKVEIEF